MCERLLRRDSTIPLALLVFDFLAWRGRGGRVLPRHQRWADAVLLLGHPRREELKFRQPPGAPSLRDVPLIPKRLVVADTRVAVKIENLALQIAPKLDEIELLQAWNEDLVMPKVDTGGDLVAELLAAANEFDDVCEATSKDRPTSICSPVATRVVRVSAFCCVS